MVESSSVICDLCHKPYSSQTITLHKKKCLLEDSNHSKQENVNQGLADHGEISVAAVSDEFNPKAIVARLDPW